MTDNPRLRAALRELGADAALSPVVARNVIDRAIGIRWLRRTQVAGLSTLLVLAAVVAMSHGKPRAGGLIVQPGPTSTAAGTPTPASTDRPTQQPSEEPPAEEDDGVAAPQAGSPSPAVSPTDLPYGEPTAYPSEPVESYSPPVKPACNLLVDPQGDTGPLPADSLDILGGDLATGTKNLVAVLRIKSFTSGDPHPEGMTWSFAWVLNARDYRLTAYRDPTGTLTATLAYDDQTGPANVEIQQVDNRILWTVPRSQIPDLSKRKTKFVFHGFSAYTARGSTGENGAADTASNAPGKYRDQQPSCVPAG